MKLPNFLVIGVHKSGTTSLHHYLRQHPQIFIPADKGTNYYWAEGLAQGRHEIPRTFDEYARAFIDANDASAIGEICPQYFNSLTAAARIHADLPDVKLVVSLRDPVARAYSDHLGRIRVLRETRSLAEATEPGQSILEDGFYAPKLQRYFDLFPREQFHLMLYDDFVKNPAETLRSLFRFLGVDPDQPIFMGTRHNPAASPRSRVLNRVLWNAAVFAQKLLPKRLRGTGLAARVVSLNYRRADPFPPEVRATLRARYREDIEATSRLIERDLSAWLG